MLFRLMIRFFHFIPRFFFISGLVTFMAAPSWAQVTVNGTTNNIPVQEIRFKVDGVDYLQTTDVGTRNNPLPDDAQVLIETILLQDGTEIFATTRSPTVQNLHPNLGTTNIGENAVGVARFDGTYVSHRNAGFEAAIAEVVSTPDFRSYWDIGGGSIPNGQVFMDIMYPTEVPKSGYLVVSERDGNSKFDFQALDQDGNPIPGAETIALRGYEWNTRIVNQGNYSTQPQHLVVLSPLLFDTTEPIFGFRVINVDGADGKIVFFRNAIQVVPDQSDPSYPGETNVINVLENDELKEQPATTDNVVITILEPEPGDFIILNADGSVDVAAEAPAGTYHITYSICEIGNNTNCAEGTVSIEVMAALPISWLDFKAKANDKGIKVIWRTATEKDNKKFQVMRSFNPTIGSFQLIGEVTGKGESSEISAYHFLDTLSWIGKKVYYRLDQYDWDGKKSSSPIFSLTDYSNYHRGLSLYPNPYRDGRLIFSFSPRLMNRTGYIQVKDIRGNQVGFYAGKLGEGIPKVVDQLLSFRPGLYMVSVHTSHSLEWIKWVKE